MRAPTMIGGACGFVRPLSERAKADISRLFGSIPVEEISAAAETYPIVLAAFNAESTTAEVQQMLHEMRSRVRELLFMLEGADPGTAALLGDAAALTRSESPRSIPDIFRRFDGTIGKALEMAPEGRRTSPRTSLVLTIADLLHSRGIEVNAKPSGALCRIVEIILEDFGDPTSDARSIVAPALGNWKV